MRRPLAALAAFAALASSACVGAPAYRPPSVVVAPAFRAVSDSAPAASAADAAAPVRTAGATSPGTAPSPSGALPAASGANEIARPARRAHVVSSATPGAPFWTQLGDSTLVDLVREALDGNPGVHAAEARVQQARGAGRLSAFAFAPTVTASAGVSRQRLSIAALPGLTAQPPQQDLWSGGVDASWELDVFGRVRHTVRAENAFAASAAADVHDVQRTLAAEVARTYFAMRGAQSELAVAERNADNQRRTVALTEQRLAAGSGTAFDTERARAELDLTLAATPSIEARIAASQYQLAALVGRSPKALPPAVFAAGDLPPLPDVVHVGSPEQLVRHRPDIVSAERQLAAQTMLVGAAKADYLPRFTIGGSAGYTAGSFGALGNAGTPRYVVGPAISWPFLDLGRVKARVDIAQAQADEAQARYSSLVLGAVAQAETAIESYDRARARLASLRDADRASTHALALAQLRFEAGATDFLQVLDAQRTLLDAESQLAQGRTAAAEALVAVYEAVE